MKLLLHAVGHGIEFLEVAARKRKLVECLGELAANADGRGDLRVSAQAGNDRELLPQIGMILLIGGRSLRGFSRMKMRPWFGVALTAPLEPIADMKAST